MKQLFTFLVAVILTPSAYAQIHQKMSYQAVIHDDNNNLLINKSVGMQVSILKDSATGTAVYVERQSTFSNNKGLVRIEIGMGKAVLNTFDAIDWASGPYFMKIETDPDGGKNYRITGTSQLLSVPYVLYAENSGSSVPGPQGLPGVKGVVGDRITHKIGEYYGGGIVFYVYDDGQHGLIAATVDESSGVGWYLLNGRNKWEMANARGIGAGKANTAIIVSEEGYFDAGAYAARVCNEYSVRVGDITYSGWYLPSMFELYLLYLQKDKVGGFSNSLYWSSTEKNATEAGAILFPRGAKLNVVKFMPACVRAIRAF